MDEDDGFDFFFSSSFFGLGMGALVMMACWDGWIGGMGIMKDNDAMNVYETNAALMAGSNIHAHTQRIRTHLSSYPSHPAATF